MKTPSELLAHWYLKTGAPHRVLGVIFGRDQAALSKIMHGQAPSVPFASLLRAVQSIEWNAEEGTAVVRLRVPVVHQTIAQRRAAMAQVGAKKPTRSHDKRKKR